MVHRFNTSAISEEEKNQTVPWTDALLRMNLLEVLSMMNH